MRKNNWNFMTNCFLKVTRLFVEFFIFKRHLLVEECLYNGVSSLEFKLKEIFVIFFQSKNSFGFEILRACFAIFPRKILILLGKKVLGDTCKTVMEENHVFLSKESRWAQRTVRKISDYDEFEPETSKTEPKSTKP